MMNAEQRILERAENILEARRIKDLELNLRNIERMAQNSFHIKAFYGVVLTSLSGLSFQHLNNTTVFIGVLVMLLAISFICWLMDAQYQQLEQGVITFSKETILSTNKNTDSLAFFKFNSISAKTHLKGHALWSFPMALYSIPLIVFILLLISQRIAITITFVPF
jgi:hypothetical protein